MSEPRRTAPDLLVAAITVLACAAAFAGLGLGWLWPARWLPMTAFLLLATLCAGFAVVVARLARRHARRLQGRPIPRNVLLRRPRWIAAADPAWFLWVGAALGAIASAIGFPGVGVGVELAVVGLLSIGAFIPGVFVADLTFEDGGLRLGARGVSFAVPWTAVIGVETLGSYSLMLRLTRIESLLSSARPDTARARDRVRTMLLDEVGPEVRLLLQQWTGGLDHRTLARAIEEGRRGRADQPN